MSESTSARVRAAVVRRILAITVGVEATVVGGYGVYLAVSSVVEPATERGAGVVLSLAGLLLAALLGAAVRAVLRARRGVRAPLLVWQILQAAVAKEALSVGSPWGVLLVVPAVVVVVGVCWPGVLHDDGTPGEPAG